MAKMVYYTKTAAFLFLFRSCYTLEFALTCHFFFFMFRINWSQLFYKQRSVSLLMEAKSGWKMEVYSFSINTAFFLYLPY